jgi:hypothetical protein
LEVLLDTNAFAAPSRASNDNATPPDVEGEIEPASARDALFLIARLIGRQVGRETFKAPDAANDNASLRQLGAEEIGERRD